MNAAQLRHDKVQAEVAAFGGVESEELATAQVRMEHANLELKLAVQAWKKAGIIAKATASAAKLQGQAWCKAKQTTADAEWEARTKKHELLESKGGSPVRYVYNMADWRACLLQP